MNRIRLPLEHPQRVVKRSRISITNERACIDVPPTRKDVKRRLYLQKLYLKDGTIPRYDELPDELQ